MLFGWLSAAAQKEAIPVVTIHYSPGHPANRFVPEDALGVAFDGHEKGDNDNILQPQNVKEMLGVGMKPLTYRLRTELGIETWHWNPKGAWSEPLKKQGYWTSSSDTSQYISLSYGYRLPRRGNTSDQANDDGYSRIDDGDIKTFWKSNPYLDKYFTKEPNAQHAQWVVIDLGDEKAVNALRILWGTPYATAYTIEYATREVYGYFDNSVYYETDSPKLWKPFPHFVFIKDKGGNEILRLSDAAMKVRFIRIRMTESSHTAPALSTDVRDGLGYAIKEIYAGVVTKKGSVDDVITHSKNNRKQNRVYVSSTDPWHRATDKDKLTEQVGIDRIYHTNLHNGLPALLPAGLLYDTPENVVSLVDYIKKRDYPVEGIELGEEPDGQMVSPEDAASLYTQFAQKIRLRYPSVSLGGPSLQGIIPDQYGEILPTRQWMERYVSYIHNHSHKRLFDFFSFEWYPFDSVCAPSAPQLVFMPTRLQKAMQDMQAIQGLKDLPFYITEYGYSAFAGISEVSVEGALMNADIAGLFLTLGGTKAYLYGWEPNNLQSDFGCPPGNNMLFGMNDNGKIMYRTAAYYGAQLVTKKWAQPSDKEVEIYPVITNILDKYGQPFITAYALQAKDGLWSVLVVNKDPQKEHDITLKVMNESNHSTNPLHSPLTCYQYSGKQYQWRSAGMKSRPVKDLPPEEKIIQDGIIVLPPYSITVIKEQNP